MDNTRIPKHALKYKPLGRRDRERPKKRRQCVDVGRGQKTWSMEEYDDEYLRQYRITTYIEEYPFRTRNCVYVLHEGLWRRGGIVQCIVSTGSRWRSVVSFAIRPFTPSIHWKRRWVGPTAVVDVLWKREIACSYGISNYVQQAVRSLYRLSYPGSQGDWETNSWLASQRIAHCQWELKIQYRYYKACQ